MKYWLIIFLLVAPVLTFVTIKPVEASCGCETAGGYWMELPDSEKYDTDEKCQEICKANSLEGGEVYDADTAAKIAAQSAKRASDQLAQGGSCTCYCGQKNAGAQVVKGTFTDESQCKKECENQSKDFVSCGTTAEASPMGNLLCYKDTECTKAGGSWSTVQPAECEAGQRYCYPTPKPIELQIHLGEIETVLGIGTYINAFYSYGLGAAAIIAVVMIMIGGVQWMIGSSVGSVDAARKRITNAAVGLILLMAAYLILNTVNPYLVQFKTIELPMIKPSLFVNGSCEDYVEEKYMVVPDTSGKTACGNKGKVIASPSGTAVSVSCVYDACANSAACSKLTGDYKCMTCQSYSSLAANSGISASASTCASLQPSIKIKGQTQMRCEYIKDVDFNDAVGEFITTIPLVYVPIYGTYKIGSQALKSGLELLNSKSTGLCGMVKIDCGSITSCSQYDDVKIYTGDPERAVANLDSIEESLEKICKENPCKVSEGPCEVKDKDPVLYTLGLGILDCYSPTGAAKNEEQMQRLYESDASKM